MASDRLGVGGTRKVVDIHDVHHVPGVILSKLPLLVACESHPLVAGKKSLKNNSLVSHVVNRLPHDFEKLTAFVQEINYLVGILAGIHPHVDQLLVAGPSSLFGVDVLLLRQFLPGRLSASHSALWLLASEFLDDVVGGTRYGNKQNAVEILVCLFPSSLGNDVKRGGDIDAHNKCQLGLVLKQVEQGFVVEQKVDSNLALVLGEASFPLPSKVGSVL